MANGLPAASAAGRRVSSGTSSDRSVITMVIILSAANLGRQVVVEVAFMWGVTSLYIHPLRVNPTYGRRCPLRHEWHSEN